MEMMEDVRRVGVVVASSRPSRICPGIASWIQRALQDALGAERSDAAIRYESIDLAEIDLPFLDEPIIPALGRYQHDHTKAWSELVDGYHGFLFVLPQYNWGYPATLKNALDFLYREWTNKPATYATYGNRGGPLAAQQIHQVLNGLHMRLLDDHLEITITFDDFTEEGQVKDLDAVLTPYRDRINCIGHQMLAALTGVTA